MIYALTITIAAGLLLLALLAVGALLAQRIGRNLRPIRGWRWYPSPLGVMLLLSLAGLLLRRMVPALLVIPIILPFFRRNRHFRRLWNLDRRRATGEDDGDIIDGQYRPLDET